MYLDSVYKTRKKNNKENVSGLLLSLMPVIGFLLFGLVPMILAIFMAFMHIEGFNFDNSYFNHGQNFVTVLSDSLFWQSIGNTFYMSLSTFINIILALVVAFLLTKIFVAKRCSVQSTSFRTCVPSWQSRLCGSGFSTLTTVS